MVDDFGAGWASKEELSRVRAKEARIVKSKTPKLLRNFSHSVQLKEFLVQIHRVDYKYVEVSGFSSFQECQLVRDLLYSLA